VCGATLVVLATSVLTKSYEGVTALSLGLGPFTGRWPYAGLLLAEILLLVWLIWGRWPRVLALTTSLVFAAFCLAAVSFALGGKESCGCFGPLIVPPLLTATIDAALALGWWCTARPTIEQQTRPWLAGALLLALIPVVGVVALRQPSLPAQATVDSMPVELRSDDWVVLVYRSDCPHCQAEFAGWAELIQRRCRQITPRWACIDIGPDLPGQDLYREAGLPEERVPRLRWPGLQVARTPVALELRGGRVMRTCTEPWQLEQPTSY
jgi:hypothetical protein